MQPDEIAEDAFWGAQNQDDTCRHIEDAVSDAVLSERRRIAAALDRERAAIAKWYPDVSCHPFIRGLMQGYAYALNQVGADR